MTQVSVFQFSLENRWEPPVTPFCLSRWTWSLSGALQQGAKPRGGCAGQGSPEKQEQQDSHSRK